MSSSSNITHRTATNTNEPALDRSPLIKLSENQSLASVDDSDAASSENPSSAKRPKVNDDDDTTVTTSSAAATDVIVAPAVPLEPLVYPISVRIPSRSLIQYIFEEAMNNTNTEMDDFTKDQKSLANAGLLSLTDVLLPAAAHCEEEALKKLQAVVQRDQPALTGTVIQCRKAIYDCVGAAMRAAVESREKRLVADEQREANWQAERELKAAAEREKEVQIAKQEEDFRLLALESKKNELKKKLPRNQELWREVAYLMTEISKLQKEERSWQQAEQDLIQREKELDLQEEQQLALEEQQQQKDQEMADAGNTASGDTEQDANQISEETAMVLETIEDITLSSIRIQQALKVVSGIITESDQVRKGLYHRYKDFQFQGYPGSKNPKGLLQALSQSQDF